MDVKEKILEILEKEGKVKGVDIARILGITRQAVNKHLKKLVEEGVVEKEGNTRGAFYMLSDKSGERESRIFKKTYKLENLQEDEVFDEVKLFLNLTKKLRKNVFDIFNYAFTEILNNAIEHSGSDKCRVEVSLLPYIVSFRIKDYGIGIFYSIYSKFGLRDEAQAVGELLKGKTTTMAERHTGEGIFFTSKSGDKIIFNSHKIKLVFDNVRKDIWVEEIRFLEGTEVIFEISRNSRRRLDDVFKTYAPEEFEYKFERTKVSVKIFSEECISRSEARRLLFGLDKFKEIILDFKDVKKIGQGFADEIFRVFKKRHPEIKIKIENLSKTLEPMIKHVVDKK